MNAQPASVMHGRLADVLLPISRGNPLHLLDMVDRLTLLSLVGALVGVVLGGGVAWFVNERGRQVLVAQAAAQANDQRLTPREQEVLRLLATTLTYQDMAAQLSVGEETIRSHVKSVLSKLGQPNRTQAVLVALKSGLLEMA